MVQFVAVVLHLIPVFISFHSNTIQLKCTPWQLCRMYSLDLPTIVQAFPSETLNEIRIVVSCTNALCLVVFGLFHISIADIYAAIGETGRRPKPTKAKLQTWVRNAVNYSPAYCLLRSTYFLYYFVLVHRFG